jgi:hypothetical protein
MSKHKPLVTIKKARTEKRCLSCGRRIPVGAMYKLSYTHRTFVAQTEHVQCEDYSSEPFVNVVYMDEARDL